MQHQHKQAFVNFINELKFQKKIKSIRELALKIGFSSQYFNQVMNSKAPPSTDLINAVITEYPELKIKLAEQMIGKSIQEAKQHETEYYDSPTSIRTSKSRILRILGGSRVAG